MRPSRCPRGHPYDEYNLYVRSGTKGRGCRACHATGERLWRRRQNRKSNPRLRYWTDEEEEFISSYVTVWTPAAIARALGRTEKAVIQYIWRHHLSPTRQHLVTSGVASEISGLSQQRLTTLARQGRIAARRVPGGRFWLFDPERLPEKRRAA